VHVVQQKGALLQTRQDPIGCGTVEAVPAGGVGAFEPVEQASLVTLGLQSSEKPRPGIRQRLVIEIDRVLRCQRHAEAERARLLEQCQQRRLRRRHGDRWQIAHHFVDVDQGTQRRRAALCAHPRDDFIEEQRDEEHALAIVEVGDRQDGHTRLAAGRVEQRVDVERITLEPHGEVRRRKQSIQIGREGEAIRRGEKAVELQDANALERRVLHLCDERRQVERALGAPRFAEQRRDENVLARAQRFGVDAGERQHARRRRRRARGQQLEVVLHCRGRRLERPQDGERPRRTAARCVDGELRRGSQARDAFGTLSPFRESGFPLLRFAFGVCVDAEVLKPCLVGVGPRREVGGLKIRKRQQQIRKIALGIHGDHRQAVDRRFFDEADAQTSLAAAGHPQDDRMRYEIGGIVEHRSVSHLTACRIDLSSEIEKSELLKIHGEIGAVSTLRNWKRPKAKACRVSSELIGILPFLPFFNFAIFQFPRLHVQSDGAHQRQRVARTHDPRPESIVEREDAVLEAIFEVNVGRAAGQ
jgi:hypothetical protein